MRINQFVAAASGLSRRQADKYLLENRITVNGQLPTIGQEVSGIDTVCLDSRRLTLPNKLTTVILNKPAGYVCSRNGQGAKTVYDLLPTHLHHLKPIGRLDKDSSGLLLLTNDGQLAFNLTHPSKQKQKVYQVTLDKPLDTADKEAIAQGVELSDGLSTLKLKGNNKQWTITMHEGKNRQIRRTFAALGYKVLTLHRTHFGSYRLQSLSTGYFRIV